MWEPRRLTTQWDFTACYRDICTYLLRLGVRILTKTWMYATFPFVLLPSVSWGLAMADSAVTCPNGSFLFQHSEWTERISLAVTFCTAVWDMLGSNLGQALDYPDWGSSWFFSAPQVIFRVLHRLGHYCFLPDRFQFIFHPIIWSYITRDTYSVVK
jgi:hypothetical protein